MPIQISAVDSVAKRMHISRRTANVKIKSNRDMLNGIKTKAKSLKDMGGFDPKAEADGQMTGKTLGGMAGGAGIGFLIGGPIGAGIGALVGAVGGSIAGLVTDIKKNDKKNNNK